MKRILLTVLVVLLISVIPVVADVVVLKDGRTLPGEVTQYDGAGVTLKINGVEYYIAAYAIDNVTLQQTYAPPLPTVATSEVWSGGWAQAQPYEFSGVAGVGHLRSQLTVTGNVVNVRTGPGTEHTIITKVGKGDILVAIAAVDGWYRVLFMNGQTGWISGTLVRPLEVEEAVMMGSVGYGATWEMPVAQPGYPWPSAPTATTVDDPRMYWMQLYQDDYLRRNIGGLTPAGIVPTY